MTDNTRISRPVRAVGCVALLALLAACGLSAAHTDGAQAVSVPVECAPSAVEAMSTAQRLEADRREEIALLDSVLESADTDQATRQNALAQKTQLAGRMELEAQARACLGGMGYERALVVCGAQTMTVLLPAGEFAQGDEARVVAAVCEQTGTGAENVKILLTD